MTPEQFTLILARLCLDKAQAASLLGVTDRTLRRYASGECDVPLPAAKLLTLAARGKITIKDIEHA